MNNRDLISKGSLGTPAARRLQARTPDDVAERIVERVQPTAKDGEAHRTMSTSDSVRNTKERRGIVQTPSLNGAQAEAPIEAVGAASSSFPPSVARKLRARGYAPLDREDFGRNFLSKSLALPKERDFSPDASWPERRIWCSLTAVPSGAAKPTIEDLGELADAFLPHASSGRLRHHWLPNEDVRYCSDGVYVVDPDFRSAEDQRLWRKYAFIARDGWIEFSRLAGFTFKGRAYYEYAPLVALCERFVEVVQDSRRRLFEGHQYWLVATLHDTRDGTLCAFGDRWTEPTQWEWESAARWRCLEDRIQVSRILDIGDAPEGVARWFAARLGYAFGLPELRCYNHENTDGRRGSAGELPRDRTDFS